MKAIILLSILAVACAQTTINIPLTVTGNANGSVTIGAGTGAGITLPASSVATAKGLLSFVQMVASSATVGSNQSLNIPVTVNADGSITVTLNGTTYTLDQATFDSIKSIMGQIRASIKGVIPKTTRAQSAKGKRSNERRGRH